MASKAKPGTEPEPQAFCSSFAEMLGDWVRQATEGFIATQKILLDLAAQQNALALTIVRERIGAFSPIPSKAVVDLSGKGVHNFFEAQRLLLEMLAQQNCIVADGLKPALTGTPAEGLANVVHRGLDNFILTQKQFLDIFEAETEGILKDFGKEKRFDSKRLTTAARKGTRTFLESQKKFINILEEELVSGKERETMDGGGKHVDLFDVAEKSVDAFIDVQKSMLDLASDQIDVNVKITREILSPDTGKHATTTLPELVRKSVDSFVAAQKALVEVASRPRKPVDYANGHNAEGVGARA